MPRTLSAASSKFASSGAVLLLVTLSRSTLAQPEQPSPIDAGRVPGTAPPVQKEPVVSPEQVEPVERLGLAPTETVPRVRITAVGSALPLASLERMLGPALKSSFHLRFSSADRFQPDDLFQSRTGSPARIHVWVDTTAPRSARIYFANRDGTRYLVRDLERSGPLDEMDREAIAQAIEWSLQALSEGTAGMTREEAEALLSDPPPEQDGSLERESEPSSPTGNWRSRDDGWLAEVALLHAWTPHSSELLGTQGPVLRVGADRLSQGSQFGFATRVHYQSPQRHAEEGVALELQTLGARLDVRYLATGLVRASGLGLRLGLGLDTVFSSPEALDRVRFEASESSQDFVPLAAAGFVWQVRVEPRVRLEMSLGAEFDFVTVRYDVVTADDTRALVSRWPLRPSASIGVALF